LVERLE
jgi:hypothetical protein